MFTTESSQLFGDIKESDVFAIAKVKLCDAQAKLSLHAIPSGITSLTKSTSLTKATSLAHRASITTKQKEIPRYSVILLTEYHANSIRLRRVILLRSDIRLAPSGIRYASLKANRISL